MSDLPLVTRLVVEGDEVSDELISATTIVCSPAGSHNEVVNPNITMRIFNSKHALFAVLTMIIIRTVSGQSEAAAVKVTCCMFKNNEPEFKWLEALKGYT